MNWSSSLGAGRFRACLSLLLFAGIVSTSISAEERDIQSLAGDWRVSLTDPSTSGATWESIRLPGTLDDAKIGTPLSLAPQLSPSVLALLQRKFSYIGPAWYRREVTIPNEWAGRHITLELERVLWRSHVSVDGHDAGSADSLTTPHRYDLTAQLTPGWHELMIEVDNRELYPGISVHVETYSGANASLAHSYTNHAPLIWNGIIGRITLDATAPVDLTGAAIFPTYDTTGSSLKIDCEIANTGKQASDCQLHLGLRDASGHLIAEKDQSVSVAAGGTTVTVDWTLPKNAGILPWDEFSPNLYHLEANLKGQASLITSFGFRNLEAKNNDFYLNGHRIFLRGELECGAFPLKGYPPMNTDEWKALLNTAREWGLNHLRFHSWCPPEAAFAAADELGFYFQIELPQWSLEVGKDPKSWAFVQAEADRILHAYGNHPSFMLLSMGNELEGRMDLLNDLTTGLEKKDPRRLYTVTTFTFQKGHGRTPEAASQYFVTQYTKDGWVRGQGVFNEKVPTFSSDYSHAVERVNAPLVMHEVGQYSVYPDLKEIPLYTGNEVPLNFIAVRDSLKEKGLLGLAPEFTLATGRFAAALYKEEIERALRTPEIDGFQLLGLHDYPGQGTALVGLLNVFWKSKGVYTASQFREFCGPVVPLAFLPKAVYERGETLRAVIKVSNFSQSSSKSAIEWTLRGQDDRMIASGTLATQEYPSGALTEAGEITAAIPSDGPAAALRLTVSIAGTGYQNGWNLWIYPKGIPPVPEGVRFTTSMDEALADLAKGDSVLLNPPIDQIAGIPGRFVPVFWSPVHFPNQPGTMGILCDPKNPALRDFPTEFHSDWQWWDPAIQSRSVILDNLAAEPIVRVIDNFARNHSLANVFQARVGAGRLLFSSIDLTSNLEQRPAARQMRASLLAYMASQAFNPGSSLKPEQVRRLVIAAPLPAAK